MAKIKLSEEAKSEARRMVRASKNGELDKQFTYSELRGDGRVTAVVIPIDPPVSRAVLSELEVEGLIRMNRIKQNTWEILLRQHLFDAVENDFEVEESSPAMNIGTLIGGNLVQGEGSLFASTATGDIDINQTINQLADALTEALGSQHLQEHAELQEAINALKASSKETLPQKIRHTLEALMRSFGYVADTFTVAQIIIALGHVAEVVQG